MEDSVSKGKTLNKEQEETLRTKQSVLGAIEELKKTAVSFLLAISEELRAKTNLMMLVMKNKDENDGKNLDFGDAQMRDLLLKLLYFGSMFDVSVKSQNDFVATMYRKIHERGCCLTYDYVTDDDASGDLLGEKDLDLISMLGELVISRPAITELCSLRMCSAEV
ncbi:hypothetical protein Leryth_020449 [Lithospermum erythrorhizon]|nr:hypothetical protein Leryth_020449 [Lithospermum erythrorhizon]